MKLYEVPKNTRIRFRDNEESEWIYLNFYSIDGMYSYCTTDDGEVVNLSACAPVEISQTIAEIGRGME